MQSVHQTVWMIRTMRGSYAKDTNGTYITRKTKVEAQAAIDADESLEAFPVRVRASFTPTYSSRVERMVALYKARPKALPEKIHHNFFP
jgi:hypothetical protein